MWGNNCELQEIKQIKRKMSMSQKAEGFQSYDYSYTKTNKVLFIEHKYNSMTIIKCSLMDFSSMTSHTCF